MVRSYPDGDKYEEDLLAKDTLLGLVRPDGGIPSQASLGARAYRFATALTRAQVEAFVKRGKRHADRFFPESGKAELAVLGLRPVAEEYRDWGGEVRALPANMLPARRDAGVVVFHGEPPKTPPRRMRGKGPLGGARTLGSAEPRDEAEKLFGAVGDPVDPSEDERKAQEEGLAGFRRRMAERDQEALLRAAGGGRGRLLHAQRAEGRSESAVERRQERVHGHLGA